MRAYGQRAAAAANPIVELHPRGGESGGARPAPATGGLEQYLAPLRGLSRDLVARGMPTTLVSELLSEIVAEFGNQVLASEQDARMALVEQILLRIAGTPLVRAGMPLVGSYVVSGPAGSGKSVLISHLALAAAQRGQTDVLLVNTEGERIGAAAQMSALGAVFGYRVEHAYTPQELHALQAQCTTDTLLLVEAAGWLPSNNERQRAAWTWQLPGATNLVCVPATAQREDLEEFLTAVRQAVRSPLATLCKTDETRNTLPAISALAGVRQQVSMVVPGPNLVQAPASIELAKVVRTALSVVSRAKRREQEA
jgi:flagellar biosynthesis GTPase FlhF